MLLLSVICGLHSTPKSTPNPRDQPPPTRAREPGAGSSPAPAQPDFDRHVNELKKKLPSNDFSIVIQPPFVVVGDETADVVKEHSERTVKWAVDKLKQDYFTKDPKDILDIWLCSRIRHPTNETRSRYSAPSQPRPTVISPVRTKRW